MDAPLRKGPAPGRRPSRKKRRTACTNQPDWAGLCKLCDALPGRQPRARQIAAKTGAHAPFGDARRFSGNAVPGVPATSTLVTS